MTTRNYTMNLSRTELGRLAMSLAAAADASHRDERLSTAIEEYDLASRCYALLGYDNQANQTHTLAWVVRNEQIAADAGEEGAPTLTPWPPKIC